MTQFFSIGRKAPPGFDPTRPTKRMLLTGVITLHCDDLEQAYALLPEFISRVQGIVLTQGKKFSQKFISEQLIHLQLPSHLMPEASTLAQATMELMGDRQIALDHSKNMSIELTRIQDALSRTKRSYNDNMDRLIRRADEINRMFELSMIGSFRTNLAGKLILANPALLQIIGYESLEALNRVGVRETYQNPKDRQKLTSMALEAPVSSFETTLIRGDGIPVDVLLSAYVVNGDNGEPRFLEGNMINHTARKKAMEDLRQANLTLEHERNMFIGGPVVVFNWKNAENWPVTYVSPNVEDIFGYTPAELLSGEIHYSSLIHAGDQERVSIEVAHGIQTKGSSFSHQPYRILRKDGQTIWIDDFTTILWDENGNATHFLGYVVDITKRIDAAAEKESLERQLQHAQKLESLGVLAGGIAHDFNNLLMAILGNADLVLEELEPDAPSYLMVKEIGRASMRAADLAKQMLAYSGRGRFVLETINASRLLEEMGNILEITISRNVTLKFDLTPQIPTFEGDATQIRQVIMNLITNAAESIGNKPGLVALSTGQRFCDRRFFETKASTLLLLAESRMPAKTYVFIEVQDTGCGMDRPTMDKIFDPFFTTKFTGRGLGMSAVLGIIRGHKGAIEVESACGVGTTFRIYFPVTETAASPTRQRIKATHDDSPWRGDGTVLVVDDEKTVLTVASGMLKCLGFNSVTASSGELATEIVREGKQEFTCVLLDLTMPKMNGAATFRAMRKINPRLKIVLCSGYSQQDATKEFADLGLADFLQKPYSLARLRGTLRRLNAK